MINFHDYNFDLDNQVKRELKILINSGREPSNILLDEAQKNAMNNQMYGQYRLEHYQRNSELTKKYLSNLIGEDF